MKFFSLFTVLLVLVVVCVNLSAASFCPCDLSQKGQICGSNGITYKNRCEFECTQKDYKKLGRTLNIAKTGPC
ncbi:agrin-like [Ceratitis capitata]|uniref:agrin-like n=1 Tax=Ceratitis capitata TaxID=7213 RepID=UPI000329F669|nr:agrin-like [Ceratitis capitata]